MFVGHLTCAVGRKKYVGNVIEAKCEENCWSKRYTILYCDNC